MTSTQSEHPEQPLDKLALLVGESGLERLHGAKVMVCGLGGVGSSCVETLARAGVGQLVIVDCDVVQPSNMNRQIIAFLDTVGQRKTAVMEAMVAQMAPETQVETYDRFVLPVDVSSLMEEVQATGPLDFIVDALDTIVTKLALAKYAEEQGIEHVSSMGAGNKFCPEKLAFADIYDTSVCPLCKVVRREARDRGIKQLRVLFSRERPVQLDAAEGSSRSERSDIGTISYLPIVMGNLLAADVLRYLLGIDRA